MSHDDQQQQPVVGIPHTTLREMTLSDSPKILDDVAKKFYGTYHDKQTIFNNFNEKQAEYISSRKKMLNRLHRANNYTINDWAGAEAQLAADIEAEQEVMRAIGGHTAKQVNRMVSEDVQTEAPKAQGGRLGWLRRRIPL